MTRFFVVLLLWTRVLLASENWVYLDDGVLRIGMDESAGAAVGWFSASGSDENLLNTFDVGRYVQQSFYGDADGSDWNGKPWVYNPVQGGSWKNRTSVLMESRQVDGGYYAKTQPRHWASGELLKEVTMEEWVRLTAGTARLRFRMSYRGDRTHKARHQELPACFVNASLESLVFCPEGHSPWTGAALKWLTPGFPNEYAKVSEPWAAWVDKTGQGVGILFPGTSQFTCYRVRQGNQKADCSYLAPIRTQALRPGIVIDFEVVLALGSVHDLRARFELLGKARTAEMDRR